MSKDRPPAGGIPPEQLVRILFKPGPAPDDAIVQRLAQKILRNQPAPPRPPPDDDDGLDLERAQ